jgi:hypothetical protein
MNLGGARMAAEGDQQTLVGAIDELARRGFTETLSVVGNRLQVVATGKTFRPDEVVVREYRRFEGVSDPDDMSIVYAIETAGGIRGTLVDAYGVYSDPAVSAFLGHVSVQARGLERESSARRAPARRAERGRSTSMIQMQLDDEDTKTLLEALTLYLEGLRRQVAGTENPEFRHALQRKLNVLERLVEELERKGDRLAE